MKRKKNCPICKNYKENLIFLKENIIKNRINKFSFSSRKIPEFMNFQLVKCNKCGLIFANKTPDFEKIKKLYNETDFVSEQDALDASQTYFKYLKRNLKLEARNNALEIGTGSGVFLSFLKKLGFVKVIGVEPSEKAINLADKKIKRKIINGMFEETKIKKNFFNLICCFMTMEHVYNPDKTLAKSYRSLKKGGAIALVTHNAGNTLHKILGKKSPIIDIEHLQLFSKRSIKFALKNNGFKNIRIIEIKNSYHLNYWINLLPIPKIVKNIFQVALTKYFPFLNGKLTLNVGNIMVIAKK